MKVEQKCQRCGERPGHKWDGTGGFTLPRRTGKPPTRILVDDFKERLEAAMKDALAKVKP